MSGIKLLILLAIFLTALTNCDSKKEIKQMPPDFAFQITEITFKYDSKSSLYTRHYNSGDSTVKAPLTDAEMISIYDDYLAFEFKNFPNEFECAKTGYWTEPHFITVIEIICDGSTKKVTNTDLCEFKTEQRKSEKFNEIGAKICRYVYSKASVNNMRSNDMIFM